MYSKAGAQKFWVLDRPRDYIFWVFSKLCTDF